MDPNVITRKPLKPYWAASQDPNDIGPAIMRRARAYYQHLRTTHRLSLLMEAHDAYYRGQISGEDFQSAGKQRELTKVYANHYRNLLQHLTVMTTSQRPSFDTRAKTPNVKAKSKAALASGLLENDLRDKQLEERLHQAVEFASTYGEGWLVAEWDPNGGRMLSVHPDTGKPVPEGDVRYRVYDPLDLVRDHTRRTPEGHRWRIIREPENRYDLIARYPDLEAELASVPSATFDEAFPRFGEFRTEDEVDDVYVWKFLHEKTDALPQGRLVMLAGENAVLFDGPLPYEQAYIYPITGGWQNGSPFGYTLAFDLLHPQRMIDALYSTIVTNVKTFGVQNIWQKSGSNLSVKKIEGGLRVIQSAEPPQPLELLATPKEVYDFLEIVERLMETLSGINSVARGNPEANLKSGTALALVASQAIQFASGLQRSYARAVSDVGTGAIKIREQYVTSQRMAQLSGKSQRQMSREWTGSDLADVDGVIVDFGNAMSKTLAGRIQIAENVVQMPPEMRQPYMDVLNTGRLDSVSEDVQNDALELRAENEEMLDGQDVAVLVTDHHPKHIESALSVLAAPDARKDPELTRRVLAHVQAHLAAWRQADPAILMLKNIPPAPQLPPPPGMPPGPPGAGPPGPPPPGGPPPAIAGQPANTAEMLDTGMQPPAPALPGMPKNPLTGQPFDPATGGLPPQ